MAIDLKNNGDQIIGEIDGRIFSAKIVASGNDGYLLVHTRYGEDLEITDANIEVIHPAPRKHYRIGKEN